ncbi:CLUMA_CG002225, isoform A [Clunio marinus]|uniref:CLUMA_CG002225, isoform A n=1 Tax=Clunio marinus TaxID=568069 RepID=A0A1J1HM78_9DIPT|nr:CLUMA_CG002225, isoform A [Clunio marinus]
MVELFKCIFCFKAFRQIIFTVTIVNGGSGETVSPFCFTGARAPCGTVECPPGTTKFVLEDLSCCCTP